MSHEKPVDIGSRNNSGDQSYELERIIGNKNKLADHPWNLEEVVEQPFFNFDIKD
jgi:hypothetical protein